MIQKETASIKQRLEWAQKRLELRGCSLTEIQLEVLNFVLHDIEQNCIKHDVSGKQITCQCEVPTGRKVTADFENQICESCGRLAARASGAVDKTVSDGLYCNCTLPNRNTTGNWCGTCNKMIAGNSVGRF